jgi:hypothetical protein
MNLSELQAKYEGILLSAPLLAAELADMVQDERADEREACAQVAEWHDVSDLLRNPATIQIADAIRNRNTKEVG